MRAIPREKRRLWLPLGVIFFLATLLRLWGLIAGSPVWHPDEIFMVVFPLDFFSGDLNPHHFYYPSLHFYTLGTIYGFCFLWQKLLGTGWTTVEFAAYYYFWNPEHLRLIARLVGVAFSVGTIGWTALLAARIYGRDAALWAALLLGVCVVYVRQSPLAGVDAQAAFWYTGAVWGSVRLIDRQRFRDYLLAGLLVGLAGGTKYPAAAAGVAVAVAHLACRRRLFDGRLWLSGLTALFVFFAVSPYILLDFETFTRHFLFQVAHAEQGRGEGAEWWYHLLFTLRHGLGWPGLVLLSLGLSRVVWHPCKETWIAASGFVGYYAAISWGQLAFTRYALPLLPLQAVLAAGAVQLLRKTEWRMLLTFLAALGPLYGSVRVARLLAEPDTRTEAREWVETHLPPATRCCNFGGWAGDVQLRSIEDHWWRMSRFAGSFGLDRLDACIPFLDATGPPAPFYRYAVHAGNREAETGDAGTVGKSRCSYVILHRHPLGYSQIDGDFANGYLPEHGRRVARWIPRGWPEKDPVYDPADAYYVPLADFGSLEQPGPEIEIWRLETPAAEERPAQDAAEIFTWGYGMWAEIALGEGHPEEAREYLRRALRLEPQQADVLFGLGLSFRKIGEPEQAIEAWRKALERNPQYAEAIYHIALTYQIDLQNYDAAIPYWLRLIEMGAGGVDAHIYLANAYLRLERVEEGLYWYRKTLERYPDMPQADRIRRLLGEGERD